MKVIEQAVSRLKDREKNTYSKLIGDLESYRSRTLKVPKSYVDLLQGAHHALLPSNNVRSRIRWGTRLLQEFGGNLLKGRSQSAMNFVFGTVCSGAAATTDDLVNFDENWVRVHYEQFLDGFDYFGMVEPAYYVNVGRGIAAGARRTVLWHVHFISWGASVSDLEKKLNAADIPCCWGDIKPFHLLRTGRKMLPIRLAYLLKAPQKAYQIAKRETISEDGEVLYFFKQWKRDLRPGERVKLFNLTSSTFLDRLCVAGGDGVGIRDRAIDASLKLPARYQGDRESEVRNLFAPLDA